MGEDYFYVDKEYRNGVGTKLLKQAMKWAKYKGCTFIIMSTNNMLSDVYKKTKSLYNKLKMKEYETSFITEI